MCCSLEVNTYLFHAHKVIFMCVILYFVPLYVTEDTETNIWAKVAQAELRPQCWVRGIQARQSKSTHCLIASVKHHKGNHRSSFIWRRELILQCWAAHHVIVF